MNRFLKEKYPALDEVLREDPELYKFFLSKEKSHQKLLDLNERVRDPFEAAELMIELEGLRLIEKRNSGGE